MPDPVKEACGTHNLQAAMTPNNNATGRFSSTSQDGRFTSLPDSPTANPDSGDPASREIRSRSLVPLHLPPPPPYPQDHHNHNLQLQHQYQHHNYFQNFRHLSAPQVPILLMSSPCNRHLEEPSAGATLQGYYPMMPCHDFHPSDPDWLPMATTTGATAAAMAEPQNAEHSSSDNSAQRGQQQHRRNLMALGVASRGGGGSGGSGSVGGGRGHKAVVAAAEVATDRGQLRDARILADFKKEVPVRRKDHRKRFSITLDLLREKSEVHRSIEPVCHSVYHFCIVCCQVITTCCRLSQQASRFVRKFILFHSSDCRRLQLDLAASA